MITKRRHKYRAKPTLYHGRRYASKAEALRAWQLDRMQAAGQITSWIPQPRFELGCPENRYVADFLVIEDDATRGEYWVEDVKGYETAAFRRNKRLWRKYGRSDLHILKRKRDLWHIEIVKGGASGLDQG